MLIVLLFARLLVWFRCCIVHILALVVTVGSGCFIGLTCAVCVACAYFGLIVLDCNFVWGGCDCLWFSAYVVLVLRLVWFWVYLVCFSCVV